MTTTPNAEIVAVLYRVSMETLLTGGGDMSNVLMRDGSTPTEDELQLIKQATKADLVAVVELHKFNAEHAQDVGTAARRAAELMEKYATSRDETAREVVPRMTDTDREEFIRCASTAVLG